MKINLIDNTSIEVNSKSEIVSLWKSNKVSLGEAASTLAAVLGYHPSRADEVWAYLERI